MVDKKELEKILRCANYIADVRKNCKIDFLESVVLIAADSALRTAYFRLKVEVVHG